MRKILSWLVVGVVVASLFISGCVTAPEQPSANNTGGERPAAGKVRVGFAMATLKEERWQRDKLHMEEYAKEMGIELSVVVADNDESKQANQVDNLLTKGIDVLIIAPENAQTAASMVEKAKAQGVPVISYDRLINSDALDIYVSFQSVKIGEMQAEYALKNAPKGNYIMVYGASTDNNALILKDAQLKVLKPAIDRGDIKIVAEQHAKGWRAEEAQKIVENALTQNKNNIAAVVASNDGTAGGVIEALAAQGLAGKVLVTGQDADKFACQRIVEGKQAMTIYKSIKSLAKAALEAAVKLAKKEKPETNATIKAVNKEVPAFLLPPQVADKANMATTVIKDGYQKAEDVYANVPKDQWPK